MKNSSAEKSKQKTNLYVKQEVINLIDTQLANEEVFDKFRTELCSSS